MTIQDYFSEPIEKRRDILQNADPNKCPFWMERLQTAVNTSNPAAVVFNKELITEYWILKQNKNS